MFKKGDRVVFVDGRTGTITEVVYHVAYDESGYGTYFDRDMIPATNDGQTTARLHQKAMQAAFARER